MSPFILDDQLDAADVLPPGQKWLRAKRLRDLRPGERILDDRVPEILRTLKQPTFITIDGDFWHRQLCDPHYCVLYFALPDDDQDLIPGLLRGLLRFPEFRTRASRMGKVARVNPTTIDYWAFQGASVKRLAWKRPPRKKR